MPDSSRIDNRCLDSWHILIFGQFKHRYPLNISCSKIFDSCEIKCMVTNLTQLGYVNNYDKNRYLEKFSKAAVHMYMTTIFKIFFSKTVWPIKAKFYVEPPCEGEMKVYINDTGHMTKMAAMPIYMVKTFKNL